MKFFVRLLVVWTVVCVPLGVKAVEFKYNHNSITVDEIQKKVNFKVLIPENISKKWTLDTKTYSESGEKTSLALHYMDKKDEKMMVAINQSKSPKEGIKPILNSEKIGISGQIAYFREWNNMSKGGLLIWVKDGTYIEMDSHMITKDKMIEIAKSMK